MENGNGSNGQVSSLAMPIYVGMWPVLKKIVNCLCPDGKRRTVIITSEPDTAFSIPAKVQMKGTTISGFVTGIETDGERDFEFRSYSRNQD